MISIYLFIYQDSDIPFALCAVKQASDLLLELRHSLLSASSDALTDLMSKRNNDGTLALPETREQVQEPLQTALESLQPSVDDFGRQLPFIYPFRQQRKRAKEAANSSVAAGSIFLAQKDSQDKTHHSQ